MIGIYPDGLSFSKYNLGGGGSYKGIQEYVYNSSMKILDNPFRGKGNRNRYLKLHLLEAKGICYWCDTPVKDYGARQQGIIPEPNEATIDHIKSRFFREKGETVEKVLACYQCNCKRAREENVKLNKLHIEKLNGNTKIQP